MSNLLFTIGDLVVFANIIALLILLKFKSRDDSTLITLIILSIFNSSMHVWGYFLKSKFGIYDATFMQHIWYLSFSSFYLIAGCVLLYTHRLKKVKAGKFALLACAGFVMITLATTAQYFSQTIFEVDYVVVASLYQYCIPYVNICTAVSAFLVLFTRKYSKRSF